MYTYTPYMVSTGYG